MSVEQNLARYTLFYDESNNIRKFLLSGKEYNIDGDPNQRPSPNFILAGIAFQEESKDLDFDKLKSSLYLPNPDEELKFAQMVKIRAKYTPIEAFKYALGNKRFTTLFEYFVKNDVLIHYHMINTVYWSFLDIIEDIVLCTNEGIDYQEQFIYKDCLYRLIKIDKDGFLTLMDKYTYPHIRDDLSLEFLKELNELIMKNLALLFDVEDDGLNARMLIKLGFLVHKCIELYPERAKFELVFNSKKNVLIEDFSHFYLYRLKMFPNSKHVLDNEFEIEEKLASISRVDDEINCINYEFVESTDKENYHVQLSDVVCGFIRLYFDFLEFSSINEVEKFSVGLNHLQKTNLQLFFSLIDNSINEAALLLHRVIVPIDEHKATVLNERLNITNI